MGYKVYAGNIQLSEDGWAYAWASRALLYSSDGDAISGAEESPILLDPELTLKANDPNSFTFKVPNRCTGVDGTVHTNPWYNNFVLRHTVVAVEEDGVEIFTGFVNTIELNFDKTKTITVAGMMALFEDSQIAMEPTKYMTTMRANGSLDMTSLFSRFHSYVKLPGEDYNVNLPMRFDTVNCDIALDKYTDTTADGWQTLSWMEILQKYWIDEYGGYIWLTTEKEAENKYYFMLHYHSSGYQTTSQKIEYGKNLLDLTITEDASDIVNAVAVAGTVTKKKGWWIFKRTTTEYVEGYANDPESMKRYGLRKKEYYSDDVASNDDCTKLAKEELDKHNHYAIPELVLTAYDRADAGVQTDRLGFMKRSAVVSAPHDINGIYLCTAQTLPLDDLGNKVFTFGVPPVTLTKQQNQLTSAQNATRAVTRGIVSHLNS